MIWGLFQVPFLFLLCVVVGKLTVANKRAVVKTVSKPIQHVVLGLSANVILSAWFAHLNIEAKLPIPLICLGLAIILSVPRASKIRKAIFSSANTKLNSESLLTVSSILFVFLNFHILINGSLTEERFSYRNGPDLFGWTSSSQFFSNGGTIENLTTRVTESAGVQNIQNLFELPKPPIYMIPSVTDQVNAEFVLGSSRFALQFLLGSLDLLTSGQHMISWIYSFIIFLAIVQFLLTKEIFRSVEVSQKRALLFSLVICLGLNILSPLLEGGLGQYFSLTLILALTHRFLLCGKQLDFGALLILSALVLGYFDGAIFLFVFVSLFCILRVVYLRKTRWLYLRPRFSLLQYFCAFLFFSWPVLSHASYLINSRISGHRGGWNQGRFPFPSDLAGFYNWLPFDSLAKTRFNLVVLCVCVVFVWSLTVVIRSRRVDVDSKLILVSFLSIYSYFVFDVYVINRSEINNYNLLKYGQYLALFNIVFLHGLDKLFSKTIFRKRKQVFFNPNSFFFASLLLLASFSYQLEYVKYRNFTFDMERNSAFGEVLSSSDIYAFGFPNPGLVQLILFGDVRYGNESRGFGVTTRRSVPDRRLVFVSPRGYCELKVCSFSSGDGEKFLTKIEDYSDLSVYIVSS